MMKYAFLSSLALLAVVIISLPSFDFQAPKTSDIQDFRLKNVDGRMVSMKDFPDAKGFIIIFTCNHCPFAKLYPPRLNALNAKYKPLGYPLIAISSTDTILYEEDTYPKMVEKATSEAFNFPYLFDETQSVAQNFKAQKTPHAYVLQKVKGGWDIRYNGAIDDNGGEPEAVTQAFVANAVDALLAGKSVAVHETKSIGCQIYFRKN